jgi:cytoskeleton protein RodZ
MALFQRIKTPLAENVPDRQTWMPSGPRSAGDVLRQRREALGLELDACAAALKIKPGFLAALEEGRPDQLPGPTYAIGWVRAYGDHLGLDSTELLRRFKAESGALDTRPDLSFPMPLGERSVPGGSMLLIALILAICGYGTWYYLSTAERTRPERLTDVPLALLPPAETPAAEPAPPPDPIPPSPVQIRAPAGGPVNSSGSATATPPNPGAAAGGSPAAAAAQAAPSRPALAPAAPEPVVPNSTPAAATAPAPDAAKSSPSQGDGSRGSADAAGASRIVIHAAADSWIQVRGTDQSLVVSRTLKAGDTYSVPDRTGLSLRTGNAGGLEIKVDGRPVPAIGKIGVLRRDVALEPEALAAGTAVRN